MLSKFGVLLVGAKWVQTRGTAPDSHPGLARWKWLQKGIRKIKKKIAQSGLQRIDSWKNSIDKKYLYMISERWGLQIDQNGCKLALVARAPTATQIHHSRRPAGPKLTAQAPKARKLHDKDAS